MHRLTDISNPLEQKHLKKRVTKPDLNLNLLFSNSEKKYILLNSSPFTQTVLSEKQYMVIILTKSICYKTSAEKGYGKIL